MSQGYDNDDLERSLKLLDQFTDRAKSFYKEIIGFKNQRIIYLYGIMSATFILGGLYAVLLTTLKIKSVDFGFSFLVAGSTALLMSIFMLFYMRQRNANTTKREDLIISCKQLYSITQMVSQFTEHNSLVLSELTKFEVKLRLTEAEEVLRNAKKLFPSDFDWDFKRSISNF